MRDFLRRRQMEESGVTGVSIWAESHAAIHTWDEDNYYAFDAFSCRDFRPRDALRLLLTHFDVETLNCVNLFRFQRSMPRVSHFQVDASWQVIVDGRIVGDLDTVDFGAICGVAPGAPATAEAVPPDGDGSTPRRDRGGQPAKKRTPPRGKRPAARPA
jgi:hypothetical protein